ncbi:AzlC family ABC transporter permease [Oceaniglobus ichthyenteri]|uniref:AzlC family ABC transporter permease n=1 Tax=Oceaniglobus ichthyenteri TaxID=2136177 RepID=UPI000D33F487|nr:AzlC family ABC transporter permease [Oceaniglobus ichthyenteri]
MSGSTTKSAYWRGARDGAPFIIVLIPFALLFGVVATEAGLTLAQSMGFNALVIAGSAQFAAVSLMQEDAPLFAVLATALAVNLRMGMYSAALVPHLGAAPLWKRAIVAYMTLDQTYTVAVLEYEKRPKMSISEKLAFFFGVATPVVPTWYAFAFVGVLIGGAVPPAFALDFALPIAFIAMVAPSLKSLAHVASAFTSVVAALLLVGLPWGTGLLIAAACAMAVGATVETLMERRA